MSNGIKIVPIIETIQLLDISDEEYFGEKYKDYISNSRLKYINPEQDGSPELYKKGFVNQYSDSLVFGSAVHELILQPNDYILTPIDRPTAKMGFMADCLYEIYKSRQITDEDVIEASSKVGYYKDKMTKSKIDNVYIECSNYWEGRKAVESNTLDKEPIYLDPKSRIKLNDCLQSVETNHSIQTLLHPTGILTEPQSYNEATLLMDVQVIKGKKQKILHLKAKLDNFTVNIDTNTITLNDLKTTGHWLDTFKEDSFVKYHYSRQMAMYLWMISLYAKHVLKIENPTMYANMLAVCTCPDFSSGVLPVSKKEIIEGFTEFKKLLRMVAKNEIDGWKV